MEVDAMEIAGWGCCPLACHKPMQSNLGGSGLALSHLEQQQLHLIIKSHL